MNDADYLRKQVTAIKKANAVAAILTPEFGYDTQQAPRLRAIADRYEAMEKALIMVDETSIMHGPVFKEEAAAIAAALLREEEAKP